MDVSKGHTALILDTCRKHGLLRNQAAYVLATALWETAHTMEPVVEAFWKTEDWRRRHLRYYPWHGRGFVQLTWERNYRHATKKLGVPLDKRPELALDPDIAARVLVVGMKEGWFTGKRLADYVTIQRSDFINARRIVNGTDKASDIASLARQYDAELRRMGYGEDRPAPTPSPRPEPPAAEPRGIWHAILRFLKAIIKGGRP